MGSDESMHLNIGLGISCGISFYGQLFRLRCDDARR
jgi:hypothetical protein